MQVFKKSVLAVVLASIANLSYAYEFEKDGFYYDFDAGQSYVKIVQSPNHSYTGDIVIPCTVEYQGTNYTVIRVGENAFMSCSGLTSVTFTEGFTNLSTNSFCDCTNLRTVTFPSSMEVIPDNAFLNCTSLSSIDIPANVYAIGTGAFSYCSSLTHISVTAGNVNYDSRNNCNAIIEKSSNTIIAGCKNTTIPASVTTISDFAFAGVGMTTASIPEGVKTVGDYAFSGNPLTRLSLPASLTTINRNAFDDCNSLERIDLYGTAAFTNYYNTYGWNVLIGNNPKYYVPASIFANVYGKISTNVAVLEGEEMPLITGKCGTNVSYSFNAETGVMTISGTGAMADYTDSNYSTNQPWWSYDINKVVVSSGVTKVGNFAFYDKAGIEDVILATSVKTVGEAAFCRVGTITSVEGLQNVTTFGKEAFANNPLTTIELNENLTAIPEAAFYMAGISELTIPASVSSIGTEAFASCKNLKTVTILAESVPTASNDAFYMPTYYPAVSRTLIVPASALNVYKTTAPWSNFNTIKANSIHITDGVAVTNDATQNGATISYTRTFNNTNWQALYVPFQMAYDDWKDMFDVASILNFHEYTDAQGNTTKIELEVRYVTSGRLKANHPYLIRAKSVGEKTLEIENTTYAAVEENSISCSSIERRYTFNGTYHQIDNLYTNGYIFLAGGQLSQADDDSGHLNPQRWYLTIEDLGSQIEEGNAAASIVKKINICVTGEEGNPTGIEEIGVITTNRSNAVNAEIYDLSGRRINDSRSGISIIGTIDGGYRKIIK